MKKTEHRTAVATLQKQTDRNGSSAKKRKDKGAVGRVLHYARPYLWLLALALLFAVIQITATLLAPVIVGKAIDCMLGKGAVAFTRIFTYVIYLLLTIAAAALFQWLGTLCTNKLAYYTIRDLRNAAFTKLNRVPLSYIDTHAHGDVMSRVVSDTDQISDGLIQGFTQLFSGVVTVAGTVVFMLLINLTVSLVVILVTPLSIAVAWLIARATHKMFQRQSDKRGEMGGLVEEMLSGQKVIKAFSYESRAEAAFDSLNADLKTCGIKAMFYSSLTNPSTRFVNGIVYAAVAVTGALIVIGNPAALSVGLLSTFLSYANQYTKPFNEITGVVTELQTATAAARRVFALLDEPEEPADDGLPALTYCDGCVDLCDVSFSYVPQRPLIQHLMLNVLPGQRVAIVGPTGCGKTTLINLLMRFYDVCGGEIRVSEQPVGSITRASLRACYGMVLQETWLFCGTIRENIAYGKRDATDEEIVAAAKQAHIHSFIERLPQGYDTVLDEDGGGISQGQKQLLCIARILLTQPPMLILDEATSSIDTRTEQKIQSAFARMMKGRTSFIIAHRLSTIKDADVILVMRDGNIVEKGTHDSLLAQGGFYAALYNSQFANE